MKSCSCKRRKKLLTSNIRTVFQSNKKKSNKKLNYFDQHSLGIVTHLSADRIDIFREFCSQCKLTSNLQDTISERSIVIYAAVLVPDRWRPYKNILHNIQEAQDRNGSKSFLEYALVTQNKESQRAEMSYYPINSMRNTALTMATTDLVCLLDVDFFVSRTLVETWHRSEDLITVLKDICLSQRGLVVLPAFEQKEERQALSSLLDAKHKVVKGWEEGEVAPFADQQFPQGHKPTEFSRWKQSSQIYKIEYVEGFEPFVIAYRPFIPSYDSRFTGYGRNKVIYFYHLHQLDFDFYVHPDFFIVHKLHPPSQSYEATFGKHKNKERFKQIMALYSSAKEEIDQHLTCDYGHENAFGKRHRMVREALGFWNEEDFLNSKQLQNTHLADLYSLKFHFVARPVEVKKILSPATQFSGPDFPVTLVTQCSQDRLPRLVDLCHRWTGPISAAVLPDQTNLSYHHLLSSCHSIKKQAPHIKIQICQRSKRSESLTSSDRLYPTNSMRNIAIDGADTKLVLLIDVDLMPCQGLYEYICKAVTNDQCNFSKKVSDGSIFSVIPAFEVVDVQNNYERLKSLLLESSADLSSLQCEYHLGNVVGFHTGHYPAGHEATDFHMFFTSKKHYPIRYSTGFEPYGIFCKDAAPKFDERFRGFGFDKVSFFWELHQRGWMFQVLPKVYLLDNPHAVSESNKMVKRDARMTAAVQGLFTLFQREIKRFAAINTQTSVTPSNINRSKIAPVHQCLASLSLLKWGLFPPVGQDLETGWGWRLRGDHGASENVACLDVPVSVLPLGVTFPAVIEIYLPAGTTTPQNAPENAKPGGICFHSILPYPCESCTFRFWVRFPGNFKWMSGGRLPGLDSKTGSRIRLIWTDVGSLRFKATTDYSAVEEKPCKIRRDQWHMIQFEVVEGAKRILGWVDHEIVFEARASYLDATTLSGIEKVNLFVFYHGEPEEAPAVDSAIQMCGFEVWGREVAYQSSCPAPKEKNLECYSQQGIHFPFGKETEAEWMRKSMLDLILTQPFSTMDYRFIFCLSTGRCGTRYLAKLLSTAKNNILSFHEASPNMSSKALRAMEEQNADSELEIENKFEAIWKQIEKYGKGTSPVIYCDTSHLFLSTFGKAFLERFAPHYRIQIVVLDRPNEEVVHSRAELGHCSRTVQHPWLSTRFLKYFPDHLICQELDPFTLLSMYVTGAKYQIRAFEEKFCSANYPNVSYHHCALNDLNTKSGVQKLFSDLRLRAHARTWDTSQIFGNKTNTRSQEKKRTVHLPFCAQKLCNIEKMIPSGLDL